MSMAHEHMEQAEHAGHAHDPFDKRVAVSVAVVAALLAGISMLGHRKHNEVLQLQGDANRLQTEAGIFQTKANIDHTHATDQWGFYQAKNIREHMYTANIGLLDAASKDPAKAKETEALRKKMQGQVAKYQDELPKMKEKAESLTAAGDKKAREAVTKQEEAQEKVEASHHTHHQADRLDFAHLGAELGIVLCSLALLTKRKEFWLLGLGAALLSMALGASAYAMPRESHPNHSHDEHVPADAAHEQH